MHKNSYKGVQSYAILLARNFSLKLVESGLFLYTDLMDLEQEFIYHYLKNKDRYDSSKESSLEHFIHIILENKYKDIIRQANTRKRYFSPYSLDENAFEDDDYNGSSDADITTHKDLVESHYDSDYSMIISADIQKVVNNLPEEVKTICRLLQANSIKEISFILNIPQRKVYYSIGKLQGYFKEARMDEYL